MARSSVLVALLGDNKSLKSTFKNSEQAASSFDKKISNTATLVKGVLAGAAVAAIKSFADDSKRAFSELEQSVGGTEAVFGDASGTIDKFAKGSAQNMGLSESAFRTATTSIGGQLKRMTGDVDLAAEQSVNLTQVAADLAATYGGTTAEAVQALGAAFRGEADPAERFNLDLKIGKVNAKALEMGLADTTGEIDDQARAQAILALITEQSADAQGQFEREANTLAGTEQRLNAQLENNKALVGRAIQGAYRSAMPLVGGLSNLMADLAISFMVSTEEMTKGEAALIRYTTATGEAVDSLEELLPLIEEQIEKEGRRASQQAMNEGGNVEAIDNLEVMRDRLDEMLTSLDLNHEELVAWNEDFKRSPEWIKLSSEELAVMEEVIRQHTIAAKVNEDQLAENQVRMHGLGDETEDTGDEIGTTTQKIKTQTEALQEQEDALRAQIDPMFNLRQKQDELAEAQQGVIDAVDEYKAGSPQHLAALRDVAEAALDVRFAEQQVAAQSGLTREEFERQLRSMRIFTDEEIALILADFEAINAFDIEDKQFDVRVGLAGPGARHIPTAKGGRRKKDDLLLVGEEGPELWVPDSNGTMIPNNKLPGKSGGGSSVRSGGGGGNVYITVNALDPASAAKAVVQAIESYKRNNGGRLPF